MSEGLLYSCGHHSPCHVAGLALNQLTSYKATTFPILPSEPEKAVIMDNKLCQSLQRKLVAFGHRRLIRGEIFLLAKAIADKLPIGSGMPENIRTYTLNLREAIDPTIFGLTDYVYLPQDDVERIYAIVDGLLLWRMSVAFEPASMVYSGDATSVVDETSGILRYVDVADICAVGDIAQNATAVAMVFQEFVACR